MSAILVAQLAKFGDLVQTIPLLKGLKKRHDGSALHLLLPSNLSPLAKSFKEVDRILPIDLDSLRRGSLDEESDPLQKTAFVLEEIENLDKPGVPYRSAYNLNRSTMGSLILSLMDVPEPAMNRLAPDLEVVSTNEALVYLLTTATHRKLHRINLIDIFLLGAGLEPGSQTLSFSPLPEIAGEAATIVRKMEKARERGKRIAVMQLGAGAEHRRWPVPHFAEVSEYLIRRGHEVVVVGSKAERKLAGAFREWTKSDFIDATGKTSLAGLAALLSLSDLLITNDTGTMHLGASLGNRVVSLFLGTASPHQTGPYGKGHIALHPDLDCYPCVRGSRCEEQKCKSSILPEDLINALEGNPKRIGASRAFVTDINSSGFELLPLDGEKATPELLVGRILKRAILFLISPSLFRLRREEDFPLYQPLPVAPADREKLRDEWAAMAGLAAEIEKTRREGSLSVAGKFENRAARIVAAFFLHSLDEAVRRGTSSPFRMRKRIDEFLEAARFAEAGLKDLLDDVSGERMIS